MCNVSGICPAIEIDNRYDDLKTDSGPFVQELDVVAFGDVPIIVYIIYCGHPKFVGLYVNI